MALTEEQTKQLEELERLRDEPEPEKNGGGTSRVLNFTIDLSDDNQLKRAFALGLLDEPKADDPPDGEGGEGGEGGSEGGEGEGPRRRGFFDN